mmetsp:Transcript_17126/g.54724  ORF Transcript_17126/g.54724 Transcript_17126/m.54724 type:complete len:220 (-) Transcript_17126:1840-2499(-)
MASRTWSTTRSLRGSLSSSGASAFFWTRFATLVRSFSSRGCKPWRMIALTSSASAARRCSLSARKSRGSKDPTSVPRPCRKSKRSQSNLERGARRPGASSPTCTTSTCPSAPTAMISESDSHATRVIPPAAESCSPHRATSLRVCASASASAPSDPPVATSAPAGERAIAWEGLSCHAGEAWLGATWFHFFPRGGLSPSPLTSVPHTSKIASLRSAVRP